MFKTHYPEKKRREQKGLARVGPRYVSAADVIVGGAWSASMFH